nr:integrase, catalytic region, zinc finger, CCHC-type, peptidase aspartic, catalytic [Tanacetum cinerariifolium]
LDNTKTRRPQPRSNTKNDRVPFASKSSRSKNKEAKVEEHHRNLLLFKNNEHLSSACNNSKIVSQDVISKVVYAKCKKCLNSVNHDVCLNNYVNGKKSHGRKHKANVLKNETQQKSQPKIKKPMKVGFIKRLATPKPRKPRFLLRWSPTGKMFDSAGKLVAPSNFESHFMGTVRFENNHVAAILGFGDLHWGNILITRVYFVEGLGHNLFSVGQFCDSDLEVAFRRNACFVRNLEGVDFLKGDRSTNLYTINRHEMASASPICLMARASSTKKKQESISSTKASSKFEAEITSSSYGSVWTNENCQYQWKAIYFGDCRRLLSIHVASNYIMKINSDKSDSKMEKEDPAIVTKSLANDFDDFIAKLSSDVKDGKGRTTLLLR